MQVSESVDKILPALAAAQKVVEIKKKKFGHNYKYADLLAVVDALDPAIEANGLMYLQTLDDSVMQADQVLILTRVYHLESGQWVESRLPMVSKNPDPQGLGSAITYGRRYSLTTIFGLCPEDDDGALARAQESQRIERTKPMPQRDFKQSTNYAQDCKLAAGKIAQIVGFNGWTPEQVHSITGISSIRELANAGTESAAVELGTAYYHLEAQAAKEKAERKAEKEAG